MNYTYVSSLRIINEKTVSSVVPILVRYNLFEINLKISELIVYKT
jgi:hypothetical protein